MNCECGCTKSQHPLGGCETSGCECDGYREPCPVCGLSFRDHLGIVGMCRKYHETREALRELIAASESAERSIRAEFGNRVAEVNFGSLFEATHAAKRSA